jgi:hypothetical protein
MLKLSGCTEGGGCGTILTDTCVSIYGLYGVTFLLMSQQQQPIEWEKFSLGEAKVVDLDTVPIFQTLASGTMPDFDTSEIQQCEALGFYYSLNSDQDCRRFMLNAVEFYERKNKNGKKVEIIYLSGDPFEISLVALMENKPFPYVKFSFLEEAFKFLTDNYGFSKTECPKIIFVDPKTLQLITRFGVERILDDPKGTNFPWKSRIDESIGNEFINGSGKPATINFVSFAKNPKNTYVMGFFFGTLDNYWILHHVNEVHKLIHQKMFLIVVGSDAWQFQFQKWLDSMQIEDKKQCEKWLKLPFKDKKRRQSLMDLLAVSTFPCLILLDSRFNLINRNALNALMADKTGEKFPWNENEFPPGCPDMSTIPVPPNAPNPKVENSSFKNLSQTQSVDSSPDVLGHNIRKVRDKGVNTIRREFDANASSDSSRSISPAPPRGPRGATIAAGMQSKFTPNVAALKESMKPNATPDRSDDEDSEEELEDAKKFKADSKPDQLKKADPLAMTTPMTASDFIDKTPKKSVLERSSQFNHSRGSSTNSIDISKDSHRSASDIASIERELAALKTLSSQLKSRIEDLEAKVSNYNASQSLKEE